MAQPARAKEKNESIRQRGNGQKLAIKHHNGGATTISTGRLVACRSFFGVERRRLYKRYVPTYQSKRHVEEPWLFEWFTKASAVCRAGRRGERSRCAVRMTEKGSAAPGMACRDRPVESRPQLGAFPAVGLYPAAGLLRTAASVLNPPPPSGSLANLPRCQGRNGPSHTHCAANRHDARLRTRTQRRMP